LLFPFKINSHHRYLTVTDRLSFVLVCWLDFCEPRQIFEITKDFWAAFRYSGPIFSFLGASERFDERHDFSNSERAKTGDPTTGP
jgi:hypothetical protein